MAGGHADDARQQAWNCAVFLGARLPGLIIHLQLKVLGRLLRWVNIIIGIYYD